MSPVRCALDKAFKTGFVVLVHFSDRCTLQYGRVLFKWCSVHVALDHTKIAVALVLMSEDIQTSH